MSQYENIIIEQRLQITKDILDVQVTVK